MISSAYANLNKVFIIKSKSRPNQGFWKGPMGPHCTRAEMADYNTSSYG